MARMVEYLRRSSMGEEDKNYSIADQQRDIELKWSEYNQHTLVKRYSDPGGKSYTLSRPVFQSMMRDAKEKRFDIVVVGRWDRFSRNQDQQAVAIYQLQRYGVQVVSATQPVPDGPIGTLMRNNYAFAAELELYNIRERTDGGKKARVRSGKLPPQSNPTYGYLFADPKTKERYVIDPETAPVVQRIYNMLYSGIKLRAIARQLTKEHVMTPTQLWQSRGWPTPRGVSTTWQHATLHRILTNSAYIGKHVGNRTKVESVEKVHPITSEIYTVRQTVERDEDDTDRIAYDETVCPVIVDERLFTATQEILKRNQQESSRNLRDTSELLLRNGFAICGYCAGNMVAQWSQADNQYRYTCARTYGQSNVCPGPRFSWRARELDAITWQFFRAQFEHPEIIRAKYEQWKADRVDGRSIEHDRIESIEKLIEQAEKRRQNNMAMASDESDPTQRAEYQLVARQQAQRVRDLTHELETLRSVLARQDNEETMVDAITQAGQHALQQLDQFNFDSRRRALFALKVKVTVWAKSSSDKITFSWGFGEMHIRVMDYLGTFNSVYVPSHL